MVNMIINPRIAEASRYRGFPYYDADLQASNGVPAAGHAFAGAIGGTDGLIIAKPEYNCSIPGTLRNAINWLSRLQTSRLPENQSHWNPPRRARWVAGGFITISGERWCSLTPSF